MRKIFEDEEGKALKQEYHELFDECPMWYWENETIDQCYERLKKEIENKKNELKGTSK